MTGSAALSETSASRVVTVADDLDDLSRRAARFFAESAREAIDKQGRFTVALSGGSTPRRTFALFAEEPFRSIPWNAIHIFWGDERLVPLTQPDNHFRMSTDIFLSKISIPSENVHRVMVESETPAAAADDYENQLKAFFGLDPGELPRFDLIILGMGADGHMASLFPGTPGLGERQRLVTSHFVPKVNTNRLTLTLPVLEHARQIMFLVSGTNKAETLRQVLGSTEPDATLPATLLRPKDGKVLWMVDQDAASKWRESNMTQSAEVSSQ